MVGSGAWLVVEQPARSSIVQNAANITTFVRRNVLVFMMSVCYNCKKTNLFYFDQKFRFGQLYCGFAVFACAFDQK
jgi:hypothetical protein